MYKEYIDKIIEKSDTDSMVNLACIFYKVMDHIEDCDTELYDDVILSLYEILYGKTFTEEKAKEWVRSMEPVGQRFTIDEVVNEMSKINYTGDKTLAYIAVNMMCNDYKDIIESDISLAFKMAKDFLNDEDSVSDKLFNYWKYIAKK
jgi:hypothetical protein